MTRLLQAEITGQCQQTCVHCFNESGPHGGIGTMTVADWLRVIGEAAAAGVETVQLIGGEPMLHPALPELIQTVVDRGMKVEVYSNLVHVPAPLWDLLAHPSVQLATSWYSSDPAVHQQITGRPTHPRIKANISKAIARSIPLRVGVIDIDPRQNIEQTLTDLTEMGVTHCGVDHMRQLGRAADGDGLDVSQLCGQCGQGILTVLPTGAVVPCPMARWLVAGSVHDTDLTDLIKPVTKLAAQQIPRTETACRPPCEPQCHPGQDQCGPQKDGCTPEKNCNPAQPCRPKNPCQPDVTPCPPAR